MPEHSRRCVLEPGRNCWKIVRSERTRMLVDADAYFRAARRAILGARHSVLIIGWDLHSRTRMVRAADEDSAGEDETLWDVLHAAVEATPDLHVYLLLWDWAILYAGEREPIPRINLDWRLPETVHLALDGAIPVGGSQHQKLLVADDRVAFCGGLDLTVRRWDTRDHAPDDPDRVDPQGEPYPAYHDVQMAVTGEAAAALGELARERWRRARDETLPAVSAGGSPELAELGVDLGDCRVAVSRVLPEVGEREPVTEGRDAFLDAIASAQRRIYIENQFLSSDAIGTALADRLAEQPELEVLAVTPRTHQGWIESRSMGAGRARFMQRLAGAGVADRVRIVYPVARGPGGEERDVFVHAKVMVVDERLLRVGSANLNNRSMGYDSECDLIVEAHDDETSATIRRARAELLAEHLGADPAVVDRAIEEHGLLGTAERLGGGERGVREVEQSPRALTGVEDVLVSIADPEEPVRLRDFLSVVSAERATGEGRRSRVPLVVAVAVVVVLVALWRFTPLVALASPEAVGRMLVEVRDNPLTPVIVLGAYVVGGLVVFPVTVLILATGFAFGGAGGFAYAFAGCMLSAAASYEVGRRLGRRRLDRMLGPRLGDAVAAVRRRGLLAMAMLRLVPVAPYTVVNAAAGAAGIGLRHFLAGTALGMVPGIAVMTAFGGSLGELLGEMSWATAGQVAGVALAWIALLWGARRAFRSRGRSGD